MTANQLLSPVLSKEIRAIAPVWLGCLASFAVAALIADGRFSGLVIPMFFLGSIALGALSIGHEYSCATLNLLLSQPRRREYLFLVKMGVLLLLLLTLSAVARIALFNASGAAGLPAILDAGARHWQLLALALPLLCGLFIAPSLTMLCRNPLAGMVFTVAAIGLVMLVGEVSASWKYGTDPTTASHAIALKVAILWWGTLAVAAIGAISSWRLFMRLEAIDDRGQALHLPWLRSRTVEAPLFAKRQPLWLLAKKELRLQQLSFVVGGLYMLGWFGIWFVRSGLSESQTPLLFVLTAIVSVAISLLAGSLASAEERQLGTLEWHALLPMSARTQWMVKAGTAVGVAVVLGLGVPMLLSSLTRSVEVRSEMQPLLTAGAGLNVILLTVVSLYVSSLCATGIRAMMWSLPVGLGVMVVFVSLKVSSRFGFDPFFFLNYSWSQSGLFAPSARLNVLSILLVVLALAMYAGGLALLLRFGRANHGSAERGSRRITNQMFRLGAFLALVASLWLGVSKMFTAEFGEHNRLAMQKLFGTVMVGAVDSANQPVTRYVVVVFQESSPLRGGGTFSFIVDEANRPKDSGRLATHLRPGRYSIVAVETLDGRSERDPELAARLKARATPLTITVGDSKTLNLTLSNY